MPKGSKVLMADDDAMLLDMYKERLGLAGYVVEAYPNGQELVNHVKEFQPDIILCDIMMPKLDGYGALVALKSDPATKDIPVIMLTALMRDFNKEKAMEGGADDYLIKSEAMPSDVITKVEQVLVKYGKGGKQGATMPITPVPASGEPAEPATSTPEPSAPAVPEVTEVASVPQPAVEAAQPAAPAQAETGIIETSAGDTAPIPATAPSPATPEVPVVDKVGPSGLVQTPPMESEGSSSMWIWLGVFVLTIAALIFVYFRFMR
jgi:CheY-like chemotaxis protein